MGNYWFCFLGLSLLLSVRGKPTKKEILEVSINCGPDVASNIPELKIITDVAISAVARCQNGDKTFQSTDRVHYNLLASLISNDSLCSLNQRAGSDTYAVEILVQYGEIGHFILTKKKIVSAVCTFSPHGIDASPEHSIIDGPIAPLEMQHIIGSAISSADLQLSIQTVDDKDAVGDLNIDRMYSIYGAYTGSDTNVGLKPVSCDAISTGGDRYAVLRAGCGDGLIFDRGDGFKTTGKTFRSPYFEAFHLGSGEDLSFDCNVTLCTSGCDGSSCETICGNVTDFSISNGKLDACNGTNSRDDTCTFNCDVGHDKIGDGISTCGADGIWTLPTIKCKPKDCGSPDNVTLAVYVAPNTKYPNSAIYTCDPGYELDTGSLTIACLATGVWDTAPTCRAKDCNLPPNVTNAGVSAPSTLFPDNAIYTCNPGYVLATGSLTVGCLDTASWDKPPTCRPKDCNLPPNVTNAGVSAPSTLFPKNAIYTCNSGYELDTGSLTVGCLDTGSWDTPPTCRPRNCNTPPNVLNAGVSAPSTLFPNNAIYTCNSGHKLGKGSLTIGCLAAGSWNTPPTCIAKNCGTPPVVLNAGVSAPSTLFTDLAIYSCNPGHKLDKGSDIVECLDTGSWGTPPTCKPKNCGTPAIVANAGVSAPRTLFQDFAFYTCNPGHKLDKGSLFVPCLVTGSWDKPPTCITKDCGTPPNVTNAAVSAPSTLFPNDAIYTCNSGYELGKGSLTVGCLDTESWNTPPTCIAKDCGTPPVVLNARVFAPSTLFPDNAVYTCDSAYEMAKGSLTVGCLDTGSWDKPPTCLLFP